ncbi:MAG: 23S rRNA (adenine(2503)-C(2))-methyltransferase RlmN [Phycisphaeraceae bacterium]|nr:23S rRNA (adenine(2503)-C(2))-methyltransferase RlmN [Phycisphaerales bacterium]MCB9860494.1 23S rRNA (adenine(2503)-C(2))-methyltransferase RlmN [Phycisphaeraceae bacterium]
MDHPVNHIFEHTPDTLASWCKDHSMPAFRATQILEWVYRKGVIDPNQMSNLAQRDRDTLADEMTFLSNDILADLMSSDDTRKLLVQWRSYKEAPETSRSLPVLGQSSGLHDVVSDTSRQTECVMIPATSAESARERRTACISSQVGCPVGCRFCASGLGGLDGNLSRGRIVEQAWMLNFLPDAYGNVSPLTNIVFMGMGEPLANFRPVTDAVRTLAAPWGMGIGARKVTISTVGLPRAIEKLADELEIPVTLALSLHAPNDALRRELIPWAEHSTIPELLSACHKWFQKTGREITLEYILLREVNDQQIHAEELAKVARTLRANVNLIRYNEVDSLPYKRPRTDDVREFQRLLRDAGINAHIRASRGRDIAAACGQLRHESSKHTGV